MSTPAADPRAVQTRIAELAGQSVTQNGTAAGIGVDLVQIAVLDRQLQRAGHRLHERYFTAAEQLFCDGDVDRLAATLAGKEAVAKTLGTGVRGGVRWTDIEILREPAGRPYVQLHAGAQEQARAVGIDGLHISLAHEGPFAVAVACGRGQR